MMWSGMCRRVCRLAAVGLVWACAGADDPLAPAGTANGGEFRARVDEIAAWLPEKPAADGRPAADRTVWGALAATDEGRQRIRQAEALLNAPVPEAPDEEYLEFTRNGNRTHYQNSFGARYAGYERLLLAECLENKGRFIPKICAYAEAFCAMRSWVLPAHDPGLTCFNGKPHVDLVSGLLSFRLAYGLAWLGDSLPAETRAKLHAEIERRTFKPHLDHVRGVRHHPRHWWYHGGNNWNSVCNCCVVRTALAIVPDRRLRAEFVAAAESSVPFALAGYTDDGYCSEGMGYWNYGYGHHLEMGLSVRAATGGKVDLFADPKTKTVMKYAYGFQVQAGISPHFADSAANPSAIYRALGRQVWPDLADSASLAPSLLNGSIEQYSLRAFGQEPAPAAPTMDVLPVRTWFPDAQVLIARDHDAARGRDFGVAMKGGHNAELHNHNDLGSYCLVLDGCEMAGDPGGEIYTRRTFSKDRYVSKVLGSYAHPVPVPAGALQNTGRKAAAKVIATTFTSASDTLVLDLTAAYTAKGLRSLTRTLVFDRTQGTCTVTDRVAFAAPETFAVPVITYRDFTAADGRHFVLRPAEPGKGRSLALDVSASAPVTFAEEKVENPGKPDVRRLLFSFEKPVTTAEITTRYTVRNGNS